MLKIDLTKRKKIILLICICIYLLSYLGIRQKQILIHRVAYRTKPFTNQIVYYHQVSRGDFGIPILGGIPIFWIFGGICTVFFLPLLATESIFWYIYPRKYDFINHRTIYSSGTQEAAPSEQPVGR